MAQIRRRVKGTGKRDRSAIYQNRFKAGTSLVYLGSTDKAEDIFPHNSKLPEVAIFGRSNVGKSSLMNILTGRKKMCAVSKRPGCTKALHFFCLKNSFSLVDTPGYGFARGMAQQRMDRLWNLIWSYATKRRLLRGGLILLDARRNLGTTELDLLSIFKERDLPICLVRTKMDKLNKARGHAVLTATAQQLASANMEASVVGVSSLKQAGIVELWALIRSMASSGHQKATAAPDGTIFSQFAVKNEGDGEYKNDDQEKEEGGDEEEEDDEDGEEESG
mmetsp:Transcript_34865/g.48532  ORF Transcript_34865/g.48532 Transcript_34865/m.48532 type:complete len:277 (-) Transcript_34865:119-949(-)|eukprot:CAMPEP_0185265238 /NCGR_PEP_ID=MMETSP1359-20130426/26852_1 /TAXON_ID=552665 /ORGANISM="Bigelowiella longifila, Strain CCMP242" /LENGTH=276 /DNA_ID=CAMNT_0027854397 /DNA_START=112 /DNA_END=942 /DNA_ORIENTATION=-